MGTRNNKVDWWKVCEHPLVRGLHRIFTVIGAPLLVMAASWLASSFDHMRQDITRLNILVAERLNEVDRSIAALDRMSTELRIRVRNLETATRTADPYKPDPFKPYPYNPEHGEP